MFVTLETMISVTIIVYLEEYW